MPTPAPLLLLLTLLPALAHAGGDDDHAGHNHGPIIGGTCEPADLAALAASYSLPTRIAAIFILLVVSAIGVFTTYLAHRFPRLRVPEVLLFSSRHFGSGVILATGFIHMLPAAFGAFGHPCLESARDLYSGWAPLIAMLAALVMHAIEFVAGEVGRRRRAVVELVHVESSTPAPPADPATTYSAFAVDGRKTSAAHISTASRSRRNTGCEEMAVHVQEGGKGLEEDAHCNVGEVAGLPVHHHAGHACHGDTTALILLDGPGTATARQRIATYILEFGIAIHSVLIGLAVGVAGGEFTALLVAVCFHQLFEGLALGQRIGQVTPRDRVGRAVAMALVFAITAPLGAAIGVGIRERFAPTDPGVLLVQGILDSIAAGILLYTAFVHLLGEDMIASAQFQALPARYKGIGFGMLWLGAAAMAVIGKWA